MSVKLQPPKKKRRVRGAKISPFPVPIASLTLSPAGPERWLYYTGVFNGTAVIVKHTGDMDYLYNKGFFGKGSLSRAQPNLKYRCQIISPPEPSMTPLKVMSRRHFIRHLNWSKMAAEGHQLPEESNEYDSSEENNRKSDPVSVLQYDLFRTGKPITDGNDTMDESRDHGESERCHGAVSGPDSSQEADDSFWPTSEKSGALSSRSGVACRVSNSTEQDWKQSSISDGESNKQSADAWMEDADFWTVDAASNPSNKRDDTEHVSCTDHKISGENLNSWTSNLSETNNNQNIIVTENRFVHVADERLQVSENNECGNSCLEASVRSLVQDSNETNANCHKVSQESGGSLPLIPVTSVSNNLLPDESNTNSELVEDKVTCDSTVQTIDSSVNNSDQQNLRFQCNCQDLQAKQGQNECHKHTTSDQDKNNWTFQQNHTCGSCSHTTVHAELQHTCDKNTDMDSKNLIYTGSTVEKMGIVVDPLCLEHEKDGHLLVVSDSESEFKDGSGSQRKSLKWTHVIKKEPFIVNEHLELSLEEAFFLSYGLGCLCVFTPDQRAMNLTEMWCTFYKAQSGFLASYIAYHYFRSRGWVVRSGMKYSAQYTLYKLGPPFYHASYSVIIRMVNSNLLQEILDSEGCHGNQFLDWGALFGINRATENVAKEILLCYVLKPPHLSDDDLLSPKCITEFKVKVLLLRRWVSSQEREKRELEEIL